MGGAKETTAAQWLKKGASATIRKIWNSKTIVRIRESSVQRRLYFHESREEIAETNLLLLRNISVIALALLLFLLWLTPYIIVGWEITPHYIFFIPAIVLFWLFAQLAIRNKFNSYALINTVCVLYDAMIFGFLIAIDVFAYPQTRATFVPMCLIVVPAVFVLRYYVTTLLLIGAQVTFSLCTIAAKPRQLAQSDVFGSIVGLALGLILTWVIVQLRAKDNSMKISYKKLSMMDSLTGILNKATCEAQIQTYLQQRDTACECALLVLDIDDFKTVNDLLGHQTGDRVLRAVGKILQTLFDSDDILGRIGGDEFAILMKNLDQRDAITQKCAQIECTIKKVLLKWIGVEISCSIGVAIACREGRSFQELFRLADGALYEAKAHGKGCHVQYLAQQEG